MDEKYTNEYWEGKKESDPEDYLKQFETIDEHMEKPIKFKKSLDELKWRDKYTPEYEAALEVMKSYKEPVLIPEILKKYKIPRNKFIMRIRGVAKRHKATISIVNEKLIIRRIDNE